MKVNKFRGQKSKQLFNLHNANATCSIILFVMDQSIDEQA
jgi:uncharacterized protein YbcI